MISLIKEEWEKIEHRQSTEKDEHIFRDCLILSSASFKNFRPIPLLPKKENDRIVNKILS